MKTKQKEKKKKKNPDFHRHNGLSCPLDWHQVFAWILTACPCILFFLVIFAFNDSTGRKFWTPLFLVPYVVGILLFVISTLCTHPLPEMSSRDYGHFCRFCKCVVPNEAKHCRKCNKCRSGFDHHCIYINNCVTTSNYIPFFFGCLFLVSSTIIGIAGAFDAIVRHTLEKNPPPIVVASKFYKRDISVVAFGIMIAITLFFNMGVAIPVAVLIGYHVYFQANGITTYDYIMDNISKYPQRMEKFCCETRRVKDAENDK